MNVKTRHLLCGLLLGAVAIASHAAERTLTVFGASSLTNVLEELGRAYTASTGASQNRACSEAASSAAACASSGLAPAS